MEISSLNPPPPTFSGLSWRPIIRADLPALAALAETCRLVDGGLAFLNEAGILAGRCFPDAPGAAVGAFTSGGHLAAFSSVHLVKDADTPRADIYGQVHPAWRGRGIGAYLMRWSQAQGQALFAAAGADKRLLIVATETLNEAAHRLYRSNGFAPLFEELVMERSLDILFPDAPLPPGLSLQTWQTGSSGRFFEVYQASFRERPGYPGLTTDQWISEYEEDRDFKPECSLLASTADYLPVGFVTTSAQCEVGFIDQVGVIPEKRRRGISTALIVEAMRRMREAGVATAQLTVNVNNPAAIQSYEALGFAPNGRRARYELAI